MDFDKAFERLLGHEGGFVDHSSDPGGRTRWGITERVARAHGYAGDMRELPVEMAKRISRASYWDKVRADDLPAAVRFDVFDAAYNSGPAQAIKFLQRGLGVKVDGALGPVTLGAARDADGYQLLCRINGARLEFLAGLHQWPAFSRGWSRRVAANLLNA